MLIREARTTDVFAMVDILAKAQARSRYADVVKVDEPFARKMLAAVIQRNGGTNEGATFVQVAERGDDILAFIVGSLSRVYQIGERDKLAAADNYLIGTEDCPPRVLTRLLDGYLHWADSNPRVVEVFVSHNDTMPGSEAFGPWYERNGFAPSVSTYRRASPVDLQEAQAA